MLCSKYCFCQLPQVVSGRLFHSIVMIFHRLHGKVAGLVEGRGKGGERGWNLLVGVGAGENELPNERVRAKARVKGKCYRENKLRRYGTTEKGVFSSARKSFLSFQRQLIKAEV